MQEKVFEKLNHGPVEKGSCRKLLLVASTGGHLAQLYRLRRSLRAGPDSLWLTFRSEQSESLLAGERVLYVPYIRPRDLAGVWKNFREMRKVFHEEKFDGAVSTGAALALGVFARAAIHRVPRIYIESVSRVAGPSVTGRLLSALHLAELQTQHAAWASERWRLRPSVLSEYERIPKNRKEDIGPSGVRLFVTLGTIRPYRFDKLVDSLLTTGLANEQTVWQLGETARARLPGRQYNMMTAAEFEDAASAADVVITHSGVGTILQLLELGIHPLVVPRRKFRNEHVDDHQIEIAGLLQKLGVATVVEADGLSAEAILTADRWATVTSSQGHNEG